LTRKWHCPVLLALLAFRVRAARLNSLSEITILLIALQFAAFITIATYLTSVAFAMHRRNRSSWTSLVSQLHPAWSAERVRIPERLADRSRLFRDAGILMQMADFAERNGSAIPPATLASLREDAVRLRLAVLRRF
jgi:hypothetical protein